MKYLRTPTLSTLGWEGVLALFERGSLPIRANDAVERVFGSGTQRGALVISGGSGIVGSGKAVQLGARLLDYGVPIVVLDLPSAPSGLSGQYAGLVSAFGPEKAASIMANIISMTYDGKRLPSALARFSPKLVIEAIPEILSLKRDHYRVWRESYPDVEIRSVTSGFPRFQLGVSILHPSFPHPINKVWEVVEPDVSPVTQLLWSLGLQPIPVEDYWSFVLDVLFCGITLAALRMAEEHNLPYWKVDKQVRKLIGPNPFRAHDAIGTGASFLTWSCLHHLAQQYGGLFAPSSQLEQRKDSKESWYLTTRPIVDRDALDEELAEIWLLGPLFQMMALMMKEKRALPAYMNAIGELCAQFTPGAVALLRKYGPDKARKLVEEYHKYVPSAREPWYPEALEDLEGEEYRQLYVNAEHNGKVGVITLGRESLSWDVIEELERAIHWLLDEGIRRVILTHDFHLATQLVGADIREFFPALHDEAAGFQLSHRWSEVARRFYTDFEMSVGFIGGKRCWGGMLELMGHCHYLVAHNQSSLCMPEITLPVVPGMEGTHWFFRRAEKRDWHKVAHLLMSGREVVASEMEGWLVDYAGSMEEALKVAYQLASGERGDIPFRRVREDPFGLEPTILESIANQRTDPDARKAIARSAIEACHVSLSEALEVQAHHSATFMTHPACHRGTVGSLWKRTKEV